MSNHCEGLCGRPWVPQWGGFYCPACYALLKAIVDNFEKTSREFSNRQIWRERCLNLLFFMIAIYVLMNSDIFVLT
jgi:hypothetical protein